MRSARCWALSRWSAGGVDTGWTFYAPLSSTYSNGMVTWAIVGVFLAGFSSDPDGPQLHRHHPQDARAGHDVVPDAAFHVVDVCDLADSGSGHARRGYHAGAVSWLKKSLGVGIFDPKLGGDPVLFQHMFWFYSHPAVYIMILPGMAVISEIIACFSRKPIYGYKFVAFSSLGHRDFRLSGVGPPYVRLQPIALCGHGLLADFVPGGDSLGG